MFDKALELVAPHHCYYCQTTPRVLCDSCIYNIADEAPSTCLHCQLPAMNGVCPACASKSSFSRVWYVGSRDDQLKVLLDDYKFQRLYGAHKPLAGLLAEILPNIPANTVLVPVPTIARHIRIRGYDQTHLIAREVARLKRLNYQRYLKRRTNAVQTGATKSIRKAQADQAFSCSTQLDPAIPYLLIDDIFTTGATLNAASKCLRASGAAEVWTAFIARQPAVYDRLLR